MSTTTMNTQEFQDTVCGYEDLLRSRFDEIQQLKSELKSLRCTLSLTINALKAINEVMNDG